MAVDIEGDGESTPEAGSIDELLAELLAPSPNKSASALRSPSPDQEQDASAAEATEPGLVSEPEADAETKADADADLKLDADSENSDSEAKTEPAPTADSEIELASKDEKLDLTDAKVAEDNSVQQAAATAAAASTTKTKRKGKRKGKKARRREEARAARAAKKEAAAKSAQAPVAALDATEPIKADDKAVEDTTAEDTTVEGKGVEDKGVDAGVDGDQVSNSATETVGSDTNDTEVADLTVEDSIPDEPTTTPATDKSVDEAETNETETVEEPASIEPIDSDPVKDSDTKAKSETDPQPDSETDTKAESKTDSGKTSESEPDAEVADADADSGSGADADSVAKPDSDADAADTEATESLGSVTGETDLTKRPSTTDAPETSSSSAGSVLKLVGVGLLAAYAGLVAAWGVDLARHNGSVMRGVTLDNVALAGFSRSQVGEVIDQQSESLGSQDLTVKVGDVEVVTDPVSLGVSLDSKAITEQAMDVGRDGFFPLRPIRWIGSFFGEDEIEPTYAVDADLVTASAEDIVGSQLAQAKEPTIELTGDEMVVTSGAEGVAFNARELVGRLPETVESGPPYQIELQEEIDVPTIDESALQSVADEINTQTIAPLELTVLDDAVTVDTETLKKWASIEVADTPSWSLDEELVLEELKPLFPTLGSEDQQASFTVIDSKPKIIPASETVVCCESSSVKRIQDALTKPAPQGATAGDDDDEEDDDEEEEVALRTVDLEPMTVGFDEGVAELESLGIIEEVSSFTTKHACCQSRVKNIQRFADLMQGVIIRPGETFSLNGHVGRRTRANGFFADGAIVQGVIEPQVGGGISQYATTFFNASFYAGLEFKEYQSHSIYISRYPRGREATISFPRPDLAVKNTTDYGILVWNEYTSSSITVTFYSTKHLDVVDLPKKRSSERKCRVDITPRVITYPDGTKVEDSVFAIYRPGEGFDCNGNSTRPEPEGPTIEETDETPVTVPDPTETTLPETPTETTLPPVATTLPPPADGEPEAQE